MGQQRTRPDAPVYLGAQAHHGTRRQPWAYWGYPRGRTRLIAPLKQCPRTHAEQLREGESLR
eukprot:7336172-Pyramimonas_sp.AAC.1